MAFASGAFFAFLGGGPFVSSDIYGLTPSQFGLHFFFVSIGYMTGNFISGRKSESVGILPMLFIGGALTSGGLAIGMALVAFGVDHSLVFFGPMIFVGIGNGMVLPNATAGIVSVRIDPKTGLLARPNQTSALFEVFRKDHIPTQYTHDKVSDSPWGF